MPDAAPPDAAPAPLESARRLRRLLDVGIALGTPRPLGELLALLLDTTTDLLGCERASILLYDEASKRLRFAAATGAQAEVLARIPVPLDASLAGAVFREDRVVLADAERDPRHFSSAAAATGFRPRLVLGVPMRLDGRPVGVLQALNPHADAFGDGDGDVLLAVAAQAAVAIRAAQQRRALLDAHERLARLDRLKSDFVAVASHEMRTPLAAVVGFAQILREEAPPGLAPHADEVLGAAGQLARIVETLEEMTALDGPADDARGREVVALGDVLRAAAAQAEADAPPGAPTVTFDLAPLVVRADAARLRLAFAHVVGNARRFTPPGGRVAVRAEADGADALVRVEDTGRGLAPEHLAPIFEAFRQADDVLTREHEGLGVGLTIARAVVERHGGRIWAESAGVGRGSTFVVRLPLADAVA